MTNNEETVPLILEEEKLLQPSALERNLPRFPLVGRWLSLCVHEFRLREFHNTIEQQMLQRQGFPLESWRAALPDVPIYFVVDCCKAIQTLENWPSHRFCPRDPVFLLFPEELSVQDLPQELLGYELARQHREQLRAMPWPEWWRGNLQTLIEQMYEFYLQHRSLRSIYSLFPLPCEQPSPTDLTEADAEPADSPLFQKSR